MHFGLTGPTKINSGSVKGTEISPTKWDVEINVNIGSSIGRVNLKKNFV